MVQLTEIDPFVSPQFHSITPEYKRRVTEIKQQALGLIRGVEAAFVSAAFIFGAEVHLDS